MTQENIGGEQKIRMGMRINVSLEHIQNCSPVTLRYQTECTMTFKSVASVFISLTNRPIRSHRFNSIGWKRLTTNQIQ